MNNINENYVLTPIPSSIGFSDYLVDSENGRIWSKKSEKILSSKPNDNGYVYVSLIGDDGKSYAYGVHRLVMASVSGMPLEMFKRGMIEVDHYPGEDEKWNNSRYNLQMSSRTMQYRESTRAKMGHGKRLKEEQVREILNGFEQWKAKGLKVSEYIKQAADQYGHGYRNMWNIVNGKSWKHLHTESA
ncbi:hypothetical protein [Alkalihalophilus marmarensis]|uniref:hypothetical protein n=1 Tax=Alkalihalophilus marmarensis TaxID=521377 RepID=UPI002E1FF60E|nr:hypothetical protein [Alkalihalophilus marmarensis]